MDVTFWVIQAVLLAPVLFMAASAGIEENRGRRRPTDALPIAGGHGHDARLERRWGRVAVAGGGLSQFSVEQQARLVLLRRFVQESRVAHGSLTDDMRAEDDRSLSAGGSELPRPPRQLKRPSNAQLMFAGGALLLALGLLGVVRTSIAMHELPSSNAASAGSLSPMTEFLPGFIASPGKYLSALNGGGGGVGGDELYAVGLMQLKEAMDRWEALAGIGLGLLLFVKAVRPMDVSDAGDEAEDESSVAIDIAPFILVVALMFAALSFFEIP